MKTFLVLALDTRYKRKDGTYPIILRIIHHQASSQISTGKYVTEKDWDNDGRKIKPSYRGTESVTRLNNQLQKKKSEAFDIISRLDDQKRLDSLTVVEVKNLLEKKNQDVSVYTYIETLVASMKEAQQFGNAGAYKCAIGALKSFHKGKELSFRDITYQFLQKFEHQHFAKGNSVNGLAFYMRTIRAIYNRAIKDGLADKESYPFENYQVKSTRTRKRAISIESIEKIKKLKLKADDPLYDPRNYFLLSFYLFGMSFADLAFLKVGNVIDGRIYYQRRKTDKPYNIKITPEIESLLNQYLKGKDKDDFLFPIIKREAIEDQYKSMLWARNRFNKKLKKIATLCSIDENLTSYVSRHSFATTARNSDIPLSAISAMMGHADIKTTEIYLASLPSDVIDDYHEKIIKRRK
jgi:site-specific recombinase XerD